MGAVYSFWTQTYPPKTKFTAADVPPLDGKVVLITGGNGGIGYLTAKAVLARNAKVYIACRDPAKGQQAIETLREATGKTAHLLEMDLANLKSIKTAVEEFLKKETRLDILFNNGGVMVPPLEKVTDDGYDLTFGINVLGHFYLTKLLLPLMIQTSKSTGEKTRIVTTSSSGAELIKHLDFATFKDGQARKKAGVQSMYFQSKLANVVFSLELARRYGDEGIVATSLNPGNIKTNLQHNQNGFVVDILKRLMLYPPEFGPLTQLYAGTSPEGVNFNGKYLIPWARVGTVPVAARDPKLGKDLWEWLEEQVSGL